MQNCTSTITFATEADTAAFAHALGQILQPGDTVLLEGDIGAGKTYLARQLIQRLQTTPEHVPSPTFTLVQTYETVAGLLWHADLYRLSDPDECFELGLIDAFDDAICLIEWPDRLGDLAPSSALHMSLTAQSDETRQAVLQWTDTKWTDPLKAITS